MRSSNAGALGEVVRRRRLELGWSQEELAARVSDADDEVRQSDISRLELGKVGLPRRARLQRIAAALGMPLGELLARSGWATAGGFAPEWDFKPARSAPSGVFARPPEPLGVVTGSGVSGARLRLQDAIAEARLTMAHSAAVLDRARKTYDRAIGGAVAGSSRSGVPKRSRVG